MNKILKEFLFGKNIFVSEKQAENPFEVKFALANKFGISICEGDKLLSPEMICEAAEWLGEYIPEPFYKGFPQTVRKLSKNQLLFDQCFHYFITYGMGNFDKAGHSVFEENFARIAFREGYEVKKFIVLSEQDARIRLNEYFSDMAKSSRPLSTEQFSALKAGIEEGIFFPEKIVSKDTAVKLLFSLRDLRLAGFLYLSDTIKLLDLINFSARGDADLKKLRLSSCERKFISKVLDEIFKSGRINTADCFEKKKIWAGFLHHIHYKPKTEEAAEFLYLMRGKDNFSVYSRFEGAMVRGDIKTAVTSLREGKGASAVLRNLNYILSRCKTAEDISCLIENTETDNALLLIQLLISYSDYDAKDARTFLFHRHNMTVKHTETEEEQKRRKSRLSDTAVQTLRSLITDKIASLLKGRLGSVYISPSAYKVALPIEESASSGGFGTLPKGTRVPIPRGKKVRAFTYWEGVDDIDLSVIGISSDGENQREFSWRTMYERQSSAITFSGDETSGRKGGSEYFDIDITKFKKSYPKIKYLIFSNNVYSCKNFCDCVCRAGYMARALNDTGEVFEPKTVKTSFVINAPSASAYLFGIDLASRELVWLNLSNEGGLHIAGEENLSHLSRYFKVTSAINLGKLYELAAERVVENPSEADVLVTDEDIKEVKVGAEIIRFSDFEKVAAFIG